MASRSTFVCAVAMRPFTQRFYFSILHGCIPVRVDLYFRAPDDPGPPCPSRLSPNGSASLDLAPT